ncbi:unnamed protein product [Hyaloperonospora brassicae]|uniref:Methyltransferase small domain-containing protein n=1 Tax=Hyaloperonospora brassicae TaxID=162125 RepID=A0AAV0UDQ2_HYABA|nr:unnamed protein product [Hyaloperonospora brassicae]
MDVIDAASLRTIRFNCRSHTTARGISDDYSTPASIVESKKVKRQRTVQTSIINVRLVELIRDTDEANEENDKHYGLFVWPSALLLCHFLASEAERLCRDKVVLELGCGTGLPSILAGLCGARKVYLTDRPDAADIRRNAEANITVNNIQSCAEYIPLSWGDMHASDEMLSIFQAVHVVLAADCFYRSEDFEKVLATVALIIRCSGSASCKFYCTYQLRSIKRSIAPLLAR